MKSEDTPFEGGPLDGRVLPVLLGLTGHPPKTYRVPVPDPAGGEPTVLVYRREPRSPGRPLALTRRWKYVHDPEGGTRDPGRGRRGRARGRGRGPMSPSPGSSPEPDSLPEQGSSSGPAPEPGATPGSGPEGTDG